MTTIIAISGSLRRESFNTALINAAKQMFPEAIRPASITDFPLYNADIELSQGIPEPVEALKNQISDADGLLIATPEYNNAIPGVLKNAVDWLSRPPADIARVFHGKPVAVTGASPGGFGTVLAQNAWLPILRTLKTRPWFEGRLMVSRASTLVDENGVLMDQDTLDRLEPFIAGLFTFSQSSATDI